MIREEITKKLEKIAFKDLKPEVSFAPHGFGDYSTNLAMVQAKKVLKTPMETGQDILNELKKDKNFSKLFSEIKLVQPGFINFYLSPESLREGLQEILKKGSKYGSAQKRRGNKVNIEFVSANPTGPLTLGNGRSAAYGESLARLLDFLGYKVTKEYFLNDLGRQVRMLGESVARKFLMLSGRQIDYPEDMYQGEYINDITKEFSREKIYHGSLEDFESLVKVAQKYAVEKITRQIKVSLLKFGVKHDVWFSESELENRGEIDEVLHYLQLNDLSYEKDGALWFKSSRFGLDKDVVIKKSTGFTTYLLSDFAYAKNKAKRKFDKLVYIFGADHHEDVARIRAGLRALKLDENKFKFLLYQLVTLLEKGEKLRMSKRAGKFITLDELLSEVPSDVAKFFFLTKSLDSHIEFDLELAKEQSNKNPVYYIQYAYVRMASILRKAREQPFYAKASKGKEVKIAKKIAKKASWSKEEKALVGHLVKFPEILAEIGDNFQLHPVRSSLAEDLQTRALSANGTSYGIHRLADYALKLAGAVNLFYEKNRVLGEEKDIEKFRLSLVQASSLVLGNALTILGLSLPEKM